VRTRTPGGVAGVPPKMEAPYADFWGTLSIDLCSKLFGSTRRLPKFYGLADVCRLALA
jgi:hypothetical protein